MFVNTSLVRGASSTALVFLIIIAPTSTADSQPAGLELLQQALEAHGGNAEFARHGFTVELQGIYDLTARMQGRTVDRPEPRRIIERISSDPESQTVALDVDWYNYAHSNQKFREVRFADGRMLYIDHRNRSASYLPFLQDENFGQRLRRYLPSLLLQEAVERPATLLISNSRNQAIPNVSFETAAGERIALEFDPQSGLLTAASTSVDMPVIGDTRIRWAWSGYREADSVLTPTEFSVSLDDRLMKATSLSISVGPTPALHSAPDGYQQWPAEDDLPSETELTSFGQRSADVDEIAAGVYMIRNLRPGFHGYFVEYDDFVVAIDAPTYWYELYQLPPTSGSRGDDLSALGRKMVRAIESRIPGKPIKHLILTHHHSDHIGGFSPIVDQGAKIVTGRETARLLKDRAGVLSSAIQVVDGEYSIGADGNEIRLIPLPPDNPKANDYLAVYLPAQKLLITTAFIYSVPEEDFPVRESIELSKYFVDWLDSTALDVDMHFNVHAGGRIEAWQLESIRRLTCDGLSCYGIRNAVGSQ